MIGKAKPSTLRQSGMTREGEGCAKAQLSPSSRESPRSER